MSLLDYSVTRPGTDDWKTRHVRAVMAPTWTGFERAVVKGCEAVHVTSRTLHDDEGSVVTDYVLTPGLGHLIAGVRIMLDGVCGRLDCGTISAWLDLIAQHHSISTD